MPENEARGPSWRLGRLRSRARRATAKPSTPAPRILTAVVRSTFPICVPHARASMCASSLVTSAGQISLSGGAPGTPSAWETPPAAPGRCRLLVKGGFAVLDRQQRRLHHRAHALGFIDLHGYLVARCQQDASLTQLAGELHTTITRRAADRSSASDGLGACKAHPGGQLLHHAGGRGRGGGAGPPGACRVAAGGLTGCLCRVR